MGYIYVDTANLEQRGRVWYARLSTPTDLRHLGLPVHWRENLRTRDLGEALLLRSAALARLQAKLAAAAKAKQPTLAQQINSIVTGMGDRLAVLFGDGKQSPMVPYAMSRLQSEITARAVTRLPGVRQAESAAPVVTVAPVAPPVPTFREAAESYVADNKAQWRRDEWTPSLVRHAFPSLGNRPVNQINTEDVLGILRPLWTTKTETGSKVQQRIESILDYSRTRQWCSGDNPARWRGHLSNVLPSKRKIAKVKHLAKADHDDAPRIWATIQEREATARTPIERAGWRALAFSILTCCRKGECLGMPWSEIDWTEGTWNRPADRMKEREDHTVVLSGAALALLRQIKGDATPAPESLVFAGRGKRGNLKHDTLRQKLQSLPGCEKVTQHGMRATFKTWAQETTDYPRELAEAALSHAVGDSTERSYARGQWIGRRKPLMEDWANYLAGSG